MFLTSTFLSDFSMKNHTIANCVNNIGLILFSLLLTLSLGASVQASEKLVISVSHDLEMARPSETIAVAWAEVNKVLPGALIQRIVVKDGKGQSLPYQVTNIAPLSKDPQNVGVAYGELIFQYSFAAGEKSASFSVEKIDTVAPVFLTKVSARSVPERLDDFAWENDKVAHRTYGPALGAPAPAGSGKEVLVTSGIDVWFKRVAYPIVDRWYNKGHDHYHKDEGEGMDMYNVSKSRGAGGTGIWSENMLYTSSNYSSAKVLANGPIRAIFELSYDSWDAGGTLVTEKKRFTIDAGHHFDQVDSTFSFNEPQVLTVAVGLNKTPADKRQNPLLKLVQNSVKPSLLQWIEQTSNGGMGFAVVLPSSKAFAEDTLNHLILAQVSSGQALRYYTGAAWERGSNFHSLEEWQAYVDVFALRVSHPVKIALTH
jgi:hypothetical protein